MFSFGAIGCHIPSNKIYADPSIPSTDINGNVRAVNFSMAGVSSTGESISSGAVADVMADEIACGGGISTRYFLY